MSTAATVTQVETVVVGAGFAGLGTAIRLLRSGRTDFVVLERGEGVGGTWRDNHYPGVGCDVPSHLYSYSFRPRAEWSAVFAPGEEIREYLTEAVEDEGLAPYLRIGTEVLSMRWDADAQRWSVETTTGAYSCRTVVVCAGRLSEPRIPPAPGLETFDGAVFHSARWDHTVETAGKRVGIVGSGASAVQILPQVAGDAGSVVLFQRSAPYVVPRENRQYTPAERRGLSRVPGAVERLRSRMFWDMEQGLAARRAVPGFVDSLRATALGHLAQQVPDESLRAVLTPDYEIGCKRVLLSDDYYPAVASSTVTVVPAALREVHGSTVVAEDGSEHELDVLVLATGFESTRPPWAERVVGRDGGTLSEHWAAGMSAYASTSVHGFPNLFVINGPQASLGHNSAVFMIETQIEHVLGALDHVRSSGVLEVSRAAEEEYSAWLDEAGEGTVWRTGGCTSWYRDDRNGRLTLLWPDFAFTFRERFGRFDPAGYAGAGSVLG